MPKPRTTRLDRLRRLVEDIEAHGDLTEQSEMAEFLQSFATRTRIRSMPLYQQRNGVIAATLTNDRSALRDYLQSQYDEIRSAAEEGLRPRGPQWPRLAV